ncbi:intein splicing region, partial [Ostertagia ostertagi]
YYCFTGDTKVRVITGEEKRLDELKVNDWVQTLKGAEIKYAPVSFWLHRVPSQKAEFVRLELSDGTELKLTAKHFIYKTECEVEGGKQSTDF